MEEDSQKVTLSSCNVFFAFSLNLRDTSAVLYTDSLDMLVIIC